MDIAAALREKLAEIDDQMGQLEAAPRRPGLDLLRQAGR